MTYRYMTCRLAAISAAALLIFAAGPLHAQTKDQTAAQPSVQAEATTPAKDQKQAAKSGTAPQAVDIAANEMEILDNDKKAIFRGAVDATRGTTNLKADTLTVTYADVKQADGTSKTDATDLDAKGNVTITTPKEVITGDWAKYNPQTDKLVVGGNVKLVQGKTVLMGNELHSDLKTNRTQMTGGRVKGSFLPK